jgi:hypothetical protein
VTQQEFQVQLERLKNEYGQKVYSTERCALIWREVRDFSGEWLRRTIDEFIGESLQPPLLPKFREMLSKERERLECIRKAENRAVAKDFFNSNLQTEEISTITDFIVKRMSGGVSDQDYNTFVKHLENYANVNSRLKAV